MLAIYMTVMIDDKDEQSEINEEQEIDGEQKGKGR